MDENKKGSGNVSFKGAVIVALVALVIGLGISGSLNWLSPSRAVNFMGEAGVGESRLAGGLPDFVNLAKKLKPIVVNISTTQVRRTRLARIWQSVWRRRGRSLQRLLETFLRRTGAARTTAPAKSRIRLYYRRRRFDFDQQSRRRERQQDRRQALRG